MGAYVYPERLVIQIQAKIVNKWLILDRDGVINVDSDQFIKSPDEWQPIPGSLEAIAAFNQAGYKIVIISNQSGIARGLFDLQMLESIHQKLAELLHEHGGEIERIYFCPHGPDDDCHCRKPKPGLFTTFAKDFGLSLDGIYAIGDSIRDLQAAQCAGAQAVLVRTGKGEISVKSIAESRDDEFLNQVPVFDNLLSFKNHLLT